jgi:hypothetical protein
MPKRTLELPTGFALVGIAPRSRLGMPLAARLHGLVGRLAEAGSVDLIERTALRRLRDTTARRARKARSASAGRVAHPANCDVPAELWLVA